MIPNSLQQQQKYKVIKQINTFLKYSDVLNTFLKYSDDLIFTFFN